MMRPAQMKSTRQNGTALIVALVMLVALMLLGISGIKGTSLQMRMGSGLYDCEIAFQAADKAMRDAEPVLQPMPVFNAAIDDGLYPTPVPTTNPAYQERWDNPATYWQDTPTAVASGPRRLTPQYIAENMGEWPEPECAGGFARDPLCYSPRYRITGRSSAPGGNAAVVLQATFRP